MTTNRVDYLAKAFAEFAKADGRMDNKNIADGLWDGRHNSGVIAALLVQSAAIEAGTRRLCSSIDRLANAVSESSEPIADAIRKGPYNFDTLGESLIRAIRDGAETASLDQIGIASQLERLADHAEGVVHEDPPVKRKPRLKVVGGGTEFD